MSEPESPFVTRFDGLPINRFGAPARPVRWVHPATFDTPEGTQASTPNPYGSVPPPAPRSPSFYGNAR